MTRRAGLLVIATAVLAAGACGAQPSPLPTSGPSAPARSEGGRASLATASSTPAVTIAELVGFTSPSGNVGCFIDPRSVRCDVAERAWSPPPRPTDCDLDYGQGITLSAGAPATFVCAGDTALHGGPPLPYGQSIAAGALRCDSAETGITCTDSATRHGFTIAREQYRLF